MKRCCLLLLLASPSAFAQEEREVIDGRPVYRPAVQHLEFDTHRVEAGKGGPGIAISAERAGAVFHPMIVLRANFEPEMALSVDQVR